MTVSSIVGCLFYTDAVNYHNHNSHTTSYSFSKANNYNEPFENSQAKCILSFINVHYK